MCSRALGFSRSHFSLFSKSSTERLDRLYWTSFSIYGDYALRVAGGLVSLEEIQEGQPAARRQR